MKKLLTLLALVGALGLAAPAVSQDKADTTGAPAAAAPAAHMAPAAAPAAALGHGRCAAPAKGDVAWM
jgi:uncharacterized low-complexity protein